MSSMCAHQCDTSRVQTDSCDLDVSLTVTPTVQCHIEIILKPIAEYCNSFTKRQETRRHRSVFQPYRHRPNITLQVKLPQCC